MITSFRGKYSFLSNFHYCTINWDGRTYPSVENAYQAAKCRLDDDKQRMVEISASDAKQEIKKMMTMRSFDNIMVMAAMLDQKFSVNTPYSLKPNNEIKLQIDLLNTGREIIIEGNTWHDNFWGNCTCSRCIHTPGANVLGALLMHVREKVA